MKRALILVACLAALSTACARIWGVEDVPNQGDGGASTQGNATAGTSDASGDGASGDGASGDAGDGGATTCLDPCTAGATQCASGAIQTCEPQAGGCTAWVTTMTCAADETCAVAGGIASCACSGSICSQPGSVCQDGQTIALCAADAGSCLKVVSTTTCTPPLSCAGSAPSAMCSSKCSDTCTAGQASCVNGGLATCTLGTNGCYAFGTPVACEAHQSCTGESGSARCTCNQDPLCGGTGPTCASPSTLATCAADPQGCDFQSSTSPCTGGACTGAAGLAECCTNACTAGATQCVSGAVQTCQVQASGCTGWNTTKTCGTHQACTAAAGVAACTCTPSVCTSAGAVCENGQTVATCSVDSDSCPFAASTMTCASPEACSVSGTSAKCSLTCSNSCTLGQKSCVNGGLAICTLGSNGCYSYGTPGACGTNESCTGAAGSATCSCDVDATCGSVAGPMCQSTSTLATCSTDTQGCVFKSSTTPCTGGACTGASGHAECCTNACTAGATTCGTVGVETCQTQTNGCTAWVPTTTCGTHQSCTTTGSTATCVCKSSICTATGTVCQDGQMEDTCAKDSNSCLYVSATKTCSSPQVCTGNAPNATCGLTCTSSCSVGQKSCINGGLAVCGLGSNGCYSYGTPGGCPTNQMCTGPSGTSKCTCNTDPICTGTTGPACSGTTTLITCSKDSNGCNIEVPDKTCTPLVCSKGACTCPSSTPLDCSGTCVDPNKDGNCGGCGISCSDQIPNSQAQPQCVSGHCECGSGVSQYTPCGPNAVCNGVQCQGVFGAKCSQYPGGCVGGCGPGSFCVGTADVAGELTCVTTTPVVCGAAAFTGGLGCAVTSSASAPNCGSPTADSYDLISECDGPNDCPSGNGYTCCAISGVGVCSEYGTQCLPISDPSQCQDLSDPVDCQESYVLCDPTLASPCPSGQVCTMSFVVDGWVCEEP